LLVLALLSAPLCFAALLLTPSDKMIPKQLAFARYSGPLTDAQREQFKNLLDDRANDQGYIQDSLAVTLQGYVLDQAGLPVQAGPAVGQAEEKEEKEAKEQEDKQDKEDEDKEEQESASGGKKKQRRIYKSLEHVFKHKNVPKEVIQKMGSFLPEDYAVPLEWNVAFEKGETVKNIAELKLGTRDSKFCIEVSSDGRYVVLALLGDNGKILVWNMQKSAEGPYEVPIEHGYAVASIILGSKGRLAYSIYDPKNRVAWKGVKESVVRVVDLALLVGKNVARNGIKIWEDKVAGETEGFMLSRDNSYLRVEQSQIVSGSFDVESRTRNFATGELSPVGEAASVGAIFRNSGIFREEGASSFDGLKSAIRARGTPYISFKKRDGWADEAYGKMMKLSSLNFDGFGGMNLSPDGLRFCAVGSDGKGIHNVDIYDVTHGSLLKTIDSVGDSRAGSQRSMPYHLKSLGVSFSPSGRHLLIGIQDRIREKVIIKIYDLLQLGVAQELVSSGAPKDEPQEDEVKVAESEVLPAVAAVPKDESDYEDMPPLEDVSDDEPAGE
jgi:WD40 repeat protein